MFLSKHQKKKEGLITYYKTYGITTLKKHVDVDHFLFFKKNKKETNGPIIGILEKQPTKIGLMH
jgi:hypothetical protein